MKTSTLGLLLTTIALLLTSFTTQSAGFREIQIKDTGDTDLTVGLWYPSDAPVSPEPITRFGMALALDAPVGDANGGLIVMSHGYGGWYAGHADTAGSLANAGYIVAAPSHTGNTYRDMSSPVNKWPLDRPRHISRVIDHLLSEESLSDFIEPQKIGVYGFSAGGYTAIGLNGGIPDLSHAQKHCADDPGEFVCSEGLVTAMIESKMQELPASAWGADDRIQAAVIAAPALGFAYPERSLLNVMADVQLWSGMLDESVPTETNAAPLAEHLPTAPESHWIENANHFAFLVVPCRESFKREDPVEYEFICTDAPGFDRYAFHTDMHKEMIRFFDDKLD